MQARARAGSLVKPGPSSPSSSVASNRSSTLAESLPRDVSARCTRQRRRPRRSSSPSGSHFAACSHLDSCKRSRRPEAPRTRRSAPRTAPAPGRSHPRVRGVQSAPAFAGCGQAQALRSARRLARAGDAGGHHTDPAEQSASVVRSSLRHTLRKSKPPAEHRVVAGHRASDTRALGKDAPRRIRSWLTSPHPLPGLSVRPSMP
jgi:hypothetical protein